MNSFNFQPSTLNSPSRALRWALIGTGLFLGVLLFGLAQLHLAILRNGPRPAAAEPVGHPGALSVAARPGGRSFVSFDGHGRAHHWDIETGKLAGSAQVGPARSDAVPQVAVDALAKVVVLNHKRSDVFRWSNEVQAAPQVQFAWSGPSRCGRYVAGFREADYVVVDAASGRELKRRRIGNLVSYTCDPHPQLRWVAWASPDGVAVGALDGQEKRRLWNGPWSGDIPFVEFSPDGRYLAVLGSTYYKRKLRIWETGTWKELPPLPVDPDTNSTFHWSPDSRRVALSIPEQRHYPAGWFGLQPRYEMVNVPQVWDLASRRPHFDYSQIEKVRGHATRILELAWSPDGKRLISADEQGRLGTWDVDQGALLRFLKP